jgi:hypothetical protein
MAWLIPNNSDPQDRPTAARLLDQPFCFRNPHFNFYDTDLYAKIRPGGPVAGPRPS